MQPTFKGPKNWSLERFCLKTFKGPENWSLELFVLKTFKGPEIGIFFYQIERNLFKVAE